MYKVNIGGSNALHGEHVLSKTEQHCPWEWWIMLCYFEYTMCLTAYPKLWEIRHRTNMREEGRWRNWEKQLAWETYKDECSRKQNDRAGQLQRMSEDKLPKHHAKQKIVANDEEEDRNWDGTTARKDTLRRHVWKAKNSYCGQQGQVDGINEKIRISYCVAWIPPRKGVRWRRQICGNSNAVRANCAYTK